MAPDPPPTTTNSKPKDGNTTNPQQEKRQRSIFELPPDFFDFCQLISSPHSSLTSIPEPLDNSKDSASETLGVTENVDNEHKNVGGTVRWTCKAEFESLQDQRSHFKSNIHRFNVKLSIAGKNIVNEEDFDELTSDSFNDYDISSISGSEDEANKGFGPSSDLHRGTNDNFKQKIFICLNTGERVSVWKSLLMNESENLSADNDFAIDNGACVPCSRENELSARLKSLIREPRDNTYLRILLLASGGHFVGCVFDGNSVVAHKTFHRYVVRAKAGKKQSSKDGGGKTVHSAEASLRRYNELALKKDSQELLVAWKPYFDASSCIFYLCSFKQPSTSVSESRSDTLDVGIGEARIDETRFLEKDTFEGIASKDISSHKSIDDKNVGVECGNQGSEGSDGQFNKGEKASYQFMECGSELTEDARMELGEGQGRNSDVGELGAGREISGEGVGSPKGGDRLGVVSLGGSESPRADVDMDSSGPSPEAAPFKASIVSLKGKAQTESPAWVLDMVSSVGQLVGVSCGGQEEKLRDLFAVLERDRMPLSSKKSRKSGGRLIRELKGLQSSVIYEGSSSFSRKTKSYGLDC